MVVTTAAQAIIELLIFTSLHVEWATSFAQDRLRADPQRQPVLHHWNRLSGADCRGE
jgi:hypothetical protein